MVRCITANASVDDHYDVLLAESLVNGFDFVLYAGPQWDNSTDGYYWWSKLEAANTQLGQLDIPHHQSEP